MKEVFWRFIKILLKTLLLEEVVMMGVVHQSGLSFGVRIKRTLYSQKGQKWEFNPEISPDGNTLYFTSLRPGGFGFGDIYVSRRVTGEWAPAENIGPAVNTAADEYHPTLSPDGAHLYVARRRPARGDFYRITITELTRQ